ncbi:MAG: hypothetical protein KJO26_08795 [Deltaproteobacteria bacterium]|nr:hypothetical protein [Deltaproteobacteria bacterium]
MSIPPDDIHDPSGVVATLEEVAVAADSIVGLAHPPDPCRPEAVPPEPCYPEFDGALTMVREAAQVVSDTATYWSGVIGGEPPVEDCSIFINQDDCLLYECSWLFNQDTGLGECVDLLQ